MWILGLKGLTTETAISVQVVCGLLVCACPSHDSVVCSVSFVQRLKINSCHEVSFNQFLPSCCSFPMDVFCFSVGTLPAFFFSNKIL